MYGKYLSRTFFKFLNRYIVVPAFKKGLGKLMSNPLTGRVMVLETIGRKTGKIRYTPVNYAPIDEIIYCYQGRHLKGKWYLNILANPRVELLLPSCHQIGHAEEVSDPKEAVQAIRQILRGSGLGGLIYGFNPFTVTDDVLKKKTEGIPVVRIKPIYPCNNPQTQIAN
jgi:deazaflavin-dependent oxidoreductase (nitroreductase family)